MNNFIKLTKLCKFGVYLSVNSHKDNYETIEKYIENLRMLGIDEDDLSNNMVENLVKLDTIVELQFYPNTPIGSYTIIDYDVNNAINRALEILDSNKDNSNDDTYEKCGLYPRCQYSECSCHDKFLYKKM